ncbi:MULTISPECIES: hypothetical protein [Streptomyces]|uniref:hypothetical protein n=1 Tax=Streptomyces TaxID=1883 RepID=UPI001962DC33|nr:MULTISPECIES: hypothetical protein [Streptomyces]QRX90529.1 hypothetical protein JNO44_06470 [Streptomyces noursei]UJB40460.1 hypothetical protein HRD51_06065 [Streptomyces sp. A1-5]
MRSSSYRKMAATLAALAVLGTVATASAASADDSGKRPQSGPAYAKVTGSAEFALPYVKDDDIRSFTFDASAAPYSRPLPGIPTGLPTDARGTVKISHYSAQRHVTYTSEGRVDCLVTGPHTATLTAVITKVSPGGPPWVGKRMGFSVYDGGKDEGGKGHGGKERGGSRDRVGFSWNGVNLLPGTAAAPEAEVGTCMAPAPYAPVTKGGYTVQHADLLPPPQG